MAASAMTEAKQPCWRSLERPQRRTFGQHQGISGKLSGTSGGKAKRGTIQAVYSKGRTQFTSTEEIIVQWKEHFAEFLNLTNPLSTIKAELEDDRGSTLVSLEEDTDVFKQPLWQRPRN